MEEDEQTKISKFFTLQLQHPTQGDWASTCQKDLQKLNISQTLEEIRKMPKRTFQNILQKSIKENALTYLLKKRGSKGSEIKYKALEMADYLLPYNHKLKLKKNREFFQLEIKW